MGRPTIYTKALAELVCSHIAEGKSVQKACKLKGTPGERTFLRWLSKEGPEFDELRQLYARARETRADARFESMEELADAIRRKEIAPDVGRVLMDIKKFQIVKENRSRYGDAVTLRGDKDAPLQTESRFDLSREQLLAIAAGAAKKGDDPGS